MTLPPRSDEFMDELFGALQPEAPVDDDLAREDEAVAAVLGRLGVAADTPVLVAPTPLPRPRPVGRAAIYGALAATLLLGVFLGRSLPPDPAPVATVGVASEPPAPVVITPPRAPADEVAPTTAEPEAPVPAVASNERVPAPDPRPEPGPAVAPAASPEPASATRVLLTSVEPAPGLEVTAASRLFLAGTVGELEAGWVTFRRGDGVTPPIDRIRFPALGLSAMPVGTIFHAAAVGDLALVTVTEGEVHLVQDDGTRLGSVRAGESVAVGPTAEGLRMVSTGGVDAGGLAVLLPGTTVPESTLQAALVAQRLRSLSSDVIRDLRGLETLDE